MRKRSGSEGAALLRKYGVWARSATCGGPSSDAAARAAHVGDRLSHLTARSMDPHMDPQLAGPQLAGLWI